MTIAWTLVTIIALPLLGPWLDGRSLRSYLEFPPVSTDVVTPAPFSWPIFIGLAVVIRSTVILIWGVEPTAFARPFGSEPLRFAAGQLIRGAVSRKENAERAGHKPGALDTRLASYALTSLPDRPRPS